MSVSVTVMTFANALWAFGIAAAFVFWPTVAKYAQATNAWTTAVVLISTALGGVALSYPTTRIQDLPSAKSFAFLLLAGLLNGMAVYFYTTKAIDPTTPTTVFVMTVTTAILVVAPVFGYVLNGEVLSAKQWLGLGFALLAIFCFAG